jgi:ectoine hydroxylase-related dioxygenase (phytanoyl-CoA dioxygenase family)
MSLTPEELACFRSAIEGQWIAAIRGSYPELEERFKSAGLKNYHLLAHLVDHERLWPKQNRVLPQPEVEKIKALNFIARLRDIFGDFGISDVVYGNTICQNQQEIYWRLVRPNVESDIGPLHADQWFHHVLGSGYGMFPPGVVTVKIWVAIYCEPGKSGLIVVPDSHQKEWRHSYVEKGGFKKPQLDEDPATLGGSLVETEPGTMVIFNERLLHGGAVNRGMMTRVSSEITMVLKGTVDAATGSRSR